MHTTGPRRYSKFELCSTRQLENLAGEFCYDVETLGSIRTVLDSRTCRHSAHVKRSVDRQLKALTAGPPPPRKPWNRTHFYVLLLAMFSAVAISMAVDEARQALATHWVDSAETN